MGLGLKGDIDETGIDYSFIRQKEGYKTKGYIPKDDEGVILGTSGVTIGAGVDLGQRTKDELDSYGLKESTVKKLTPYLGLKGATAEKKLKSDPLSITDDKELKLLTDTVLEANIKPYIDYYEEETGEKFSDLDSKVQTAVGSVVTQYGPDLETRTPTFNTHIINKDIPAAKKELEDFGDDYPTRRKSEASLLDGLSRLNPFSVGEASAAEEPSGLGLTGDIEQSGLDLSGDIEGGDPSDELNIWQKTLTGTVSRTFENIGASVDETFKKIKANPLVGMFGEQFRQGADIHAAVQDQMASTLRPLAIAYDYYADKLTKDQSKENLEKRRGLEQLADAYVQIAAEAREQGVDASTAVGKINKAIGHGIGSAIGFIPKAMLSSAIPGIGPVIGMGVVTGMEATPEGSDKALAEFIKGSFMHQYLKGTSLLPTPIQVPTMASLFMGQAALGGAEYDEIIASGIMGVGFAMSAKAPSMKAFRSRYAKINKKALYEKQLKEVMGMKKTANFEQWQSEAKAVIDTFAKPGILKAEIRNILNENGVTVTDAKVRYLENEIRNVWGSQVAGANKRGSGGLRIMTPREMLGTSEIGAAERVAYQAKLKKQAVLNRARPEEDVPLHPAAEGKAAAEALKPQKKVFPDETNAYNLRLKEMASQGLIDSLDIPLHPPAEGKAAVKVLEGKYIEERKIKERNDTIDNIMDFVSAFDTKNPLVKDEEGNVQRLTAGLPGLFSNIGGQKKISEVLTKWKNGEELNEGDQALAEDVLGKWNEMRQSAIDRSNEAEEELTQIMKENPEITNEEIFKNEQQQEELWDEEKDLSKTVTEYIEEKGSVEKVETGDEVGEVKPVKQRLTGAKQTVRSDLKEADVDIGLINMAIEKGVGFDELYGMIRGSRSAEDLNINTAVFSENLRAILDAGETLEIDMNVKEKPAAKEEKPEVKKPSEEKVETIKERIARRSAEISKKEEIAGKRTIEELPNLTDDELREVINSGQTMGVIKGRAREILDTRKEQATRESLPIDISMEDIPYQKAYQAYSNISFSPEKRAASTQRDYLNTMQNFYEKFKDLAKSPEQKEILKSELESFKEGYIKRELAVLSAKGRTLSSMITGPAKFPTARNRKALNAEQSRIEDLLEFIKKAKTRASKRISQQDIADRGGEFEVSKQELAKAEKNIQLMKDVNKIVRKKGMSEDKKVEAIIEISGWEKSVVKKLFEPYLGQTGFPSFQLTNANSRLKRLRAKVDSMATAETLSGQEDLGQYEGVKIINNFDEERVQLDFDEKPNEELRTKLKRGGWRWSPRQGVWQRKNTANGLSAARQIAREFFGAEQLPVEKEDYTPGETGLGEYWSPNKTKKMLDDNKGQVYIPFEWEVALPTKETSGDAFQDHVSYFEDMQLPEDSKIRDLKKRIQRVNGLRLSGKLTPTQANQKIARLRGEILKAAVDEGVSIVRTPNGKYKLGMREKSGVYVPADFSEYQNFKDLSTGGIIDTSRMIQEIDGSLSVKQKAKLPGQAGPAERYVLWRTRDMLIHKMNFMEQAGRKVSEIFRDIKPNSEEDHAITQIMNSGETEGHSEKVIKKAEALRKFYDELLDQQNELRVMRGQDPIPYRRNYTAQVLADVSVWGQLFNKNKEDVDIQKEAFIPDYVIPNKPFNPREMARKGDMPYQLMLKSSYELAKRYLGTAAKDIFNTSIIQNNKAFISQFEALGYKKSAEALAGWNAEAFAGVKASLDRWATKMGIMPSWVSWTLRKTNNIRNLAVFPFRLAWTTGTQIKSLALTVGRYGYGRTINGIIQYMNPENRQQLRDIYSFRVKSQKVGKVTAQDSKNLIDGMLDEKRSVTERWNDAGTFILEEMEKLLTGASVFAGYEVGKAKGLEGEALNQFASDAGAKTQSMYNDEDKPGILRNLLVKSIAPYQTFKFEMLNSLRELVGQTGTPPDDKREAALIFMRFLSAAILMRLIADWASKKDAREIVNPVPFSQWTVDPIVDKAIGRRSYERGTLPSFTGMATELTEGLARSVQTKQIDRKLRNTLIKYVPGMFGVGGGGQAANLVDTLIAYSQGGIYDKSKRLMFRVEKDDIARGIYSGIWTTRGGKEYIEKRFIAPKAFQKPYAKSIMGKKKVFPTTQKEWEKIPLNMRRGKDKILLKTETKPRKALFIDTKKGKIKYDKLLKREK